MSPSKLKKPEGWDEVPDSEVEGEPRITPYTIDKPAPKCAWCEDDAEVEVTHTHSHDKKFVTEVVKTPTLFDTMATGDGPLCQADYDRSYTGQYWAEYQRAEDRQQEFVAGIE